MGIHPATDSAVEIILILFLLAFIFLVLKVLYDSFQVVRAIAVFIYKRYINASLIYVDLKPRYKKILADYVDYYRNLDDRHRHIFEQRVARFMGMKEFIARGKGMDVTPEMRVLISAVAIQLTFGLPRVYLTHFHRILIYPDSYYSTISQRYHHGEVNYRGLIILSWKKFLEGWINRDDGTNLGLHEMAHHG